MAAPAATPARHHRGAHRVQVPGSTLSWAVPLFLGAFFGFYAGFLRRTGTAVSWWDVLFGVVAGVVFAGLVYGLGRIQGAMIQEVRAISYGALAGAAVGFLHSLTGDSVLNSTGIGLAVGLATGVASFYVFHTREP
ncbi:hypothetical protein AB0G74_11055 [Streptomyces sp. NPDC020875]|uniref:hypothetical protein n=1 Tax=Streptomyces sp. NPDC020875 TaxID=3154898 RepID=UPI0033D2461C